MQHRERIQHMQHVQHTVHAAHTEHTTLELHKFLLLGSFDHMTLLMFNEDWSQKDGR